MLELRFCHGFEQMQWHDKLFCNSHKQSVFRALCWDLYILYTIKSPSYAYSSARLTTYIVTTSFSHASILSDSLCCYTNWYLLWHRKKSKFTGCDSESLLHCCHTLLLLFPLEAKLIYMKILGERLESTVYSWSLKH